MWTMSPGMNGSAPTTKPVRKGKTATIAICSTPIHSRLNPRQGGVCRAPGFGRPIDSGGALR